MGRLRALCLGLRVERAASAPAVWVVEIVSGTVHATPSWATLLLVIALATSRVLARSASG